MTDLYVLGINGSERAKNNEAALRAAIEYRLIDRGTAMSEYLGQLEDEPATCILNLDPSVASNITKENWRLPALADIDLELFKEIRRGGYPYDIKSYIHKTKTYRICLACMTSPWLRVDIPEPHIEQDKVNQLWDDLKVLTNMQRPSLELPRYMKLQERTHMSCYWRSLAALLGGDETLSFDWLQRVTSFLFERAFPAGITARQLEDKDPSVFGSSKNMLVHPETIKFVLQQSDFRLTTVSHDDSAHHTCGRRLWVGWHVDNTLYQKSSKARTKELKARAASPVAKMLAPTTDCAVKGNDEHEVESIAYEPKMEAYIVKWVGYTEVSFEPPSNMRHISGNLLSQAKAKPGKQVLVSTKPKPNTRQLKPWLQLRIKQPSMYHTGLKHVIPAWNDHGCYRDLLDGKPSAPWWDSVRYFQDGTPHGSIFQKNKSPPVATLQLWIKLDEELIPWCSCAKHVEAITQAIADNKASFRDITRPDTSRRVLFSSSSSSSSMVFMSLSIFVTYRVCD